MDLAHGPGMPLPQRPSSTLSLRLGNLLALLLPLLLGVAPAQERRPRFVLPEPPFVYDDVRPELQARRLTCPSGAPADPAPDPAAAAAAAKAAALRDLRAALGRVLFHDQLLSKSRRVSCASCHRQEHGFADPRAFSKGFRGRRTRRNAMSIVNLAYQQGPFFWDGRADRLEQMVLMPIEDEVEMGLPMDELLRRLRADPDYVALFERAFESRYICRERVGEALATFVRAIVSHGSRYDRGLAAVGGDPDRPFPNFTAVENRGKALFFGSAHGRKNSCAACHVARMHGGCGNSFVIQPALFSHEGLRNNGLGDNGRRDVGHAAVSGDDRHVRHFRAPSLRNVAVTGPYMHDGRLRRLEDVVAFYARGVRRERHLDPALRGNRTSSWGAVPAAVAATARTPAAPMLGPPTGFPMGSRQQRALVAFLKTLTDDRLLRDPRFSDPFDR